MFGPAASGNTNGSFFLPLIWKRLPLTFPISEKENMTLKQIPNKTNSSLQMTMIQKNLIYFFTVAAPDDEKLIKVSNICYSKN